VYIDPAAPTLALPSGRLPSLDAGGDWDLLAQDVDVLRAANEFEMGSPVEVGFDRDGRVVLVRGHGEFVAARRAQASSLEATVVVRHQRWESVKERIRDYARNHGGRVYQQIDHPDLRDFPFHHGSDRVGLLRKALEDFACTGRPLVDVGAHWGHMSQQMEKLGFVCTAVEANKQSADIATALAKASRYNLTVWLGDVLQFPDATKQEVVLALNIFHHLIKTEEGHAGLIAFLQRLHAAELILFEPHVADPPAQMRGAFRNYPEEDFAAFISEHAGMRDIELLGRAGDGRPLFRLSR
jgi:hypothetical protein